MSSPAVARSFLKLSSEIRNHIYGYCTPIDGHVHDYYGLLLSCKRIHIEYGGKAVEIISKLLDEVKRAWLPRYASPLRISKHTCLGDMANIMVEFPKSLYDRPETNQTPDPDEPAPCLEPAVPSLLQLHPKKLNITYYEDKPVPAGGYKFWVPPCGTTAEPTTKPLNTRLVTIKYLDDESDADKNQLCFVPFHSSLSTLANRDMVEGWKSYLDGYICFWVDVEGDGEL